MDKEKRELRFPERYELEATMYEGLVLGRVVGQAKDIYNVVTNAGRMLAQVAGKLRYEARLAVDFPAVGDYVMLDRIDDTDGNAVIHHVLTRKSAFERKAAGTSVSTQIVAANVDTLFICMSLNNDYNLRRLERYLSVGWDSGASPVVVLTKADLCEGIEAKRSEVVSIAVGADVLVTTSMREDGYGDILRYIGPGKTVAFIGSSGVGKSTLINRLLGEDAIKTDGLRDDDKGRHTTTRRELHMLRGGGAVIDTPGMRELGIEHADFSKTFADIEELAQQCRFADCKHKTEPGCAVLAAIEAGELAPGRLKSFEKLKREARYQSLDSVTAEREKLDIMFGQFGGLKAAKKMLKRQNKIDKYKE